MENPSNDDTLLARWLEGKLSEAELEALQRREDYGDLQKILAAADRLALPDFDEQAAFERLKAKLPPVAVEPTLPVQVVEATPLPYPAQPSVSEPTASLPVPANALPVISHLQQQQAAPPTPPQPAQQGAKIRRMGYLKYVLAAAAALALLLVFRPWESMQEQGCRTSDVGEKKELKLPDGSQVTLNAVSQLCFTTQSWREERLIELEGEAYFRVKKGKTFTVRTGSGDVRVVGTIFNVFARGEELTVQCAEGKVQVSNEEGTQQTLIKAGETVSVLNGRLQAREGLRRNPSWFKGESSFQSASLSKVFEELQRQYSLDVQADSVDMSRTFTGKFVHGDLEKALKMVCGPMDLFYEEQVVEEKKVWVFRQQ